MNLIRSTAIFLFSVALIVWPIIQNRGEAQDVNDAPAAFDNKTNGLLSQQRFDLLRMKFEASKSPDEGLGPVFNGTSCGECHGNPVAGGASQVTEVRAGRMVGRSFEEHPGGSLIQDRSTNSEVQERLMENFDLLSLRLSSSVLGSGFVESIDDATLAAIAASQPPAVRGEILNVPVLEAGGTLRTGRFGWKNQHASLESFAADALLNEMGITNPFFATENSSNGRSVAEFDNLADPEDDGQTVRELAEFMRSTKAPPRNEQVAATTDSVLGSLLFERIGCAICHTPIIQTAPVGTAINGGALRVQPALGNKLVHPYGDFLLHDIGTGDGIVQNGGPATSSKLRTAPLWGMRTRTRLMHDGLSLTVIDAIQRHGGQSIISTMLFRSLPQLEQRQLLIFLSSL